MSLGILFKELEEVYTCIQLQLPLLLQYTLNIMCHGYTYSFNFSLYEEDFFLIGAIAMEHSMYTEALLWFNAANNLIGT